MLPLHLIDHNPRQSRQAFDPEALRELADSIREHGVLQPILVRPVEGRFQIVAGERRYHAASMAGLESIPAIVLERDDTEAAFATAVENLHREQLDIEDEARTFAYLVELSGLSQRKLAKRLGINHVYLSRRLKLLKHPDLMQAYRQGQVSLLEVLKQTDNVAPIQDEAGAAESADEPARDEDAAPTAEEGYVLIEREDLPGFIVARTPGATDASGTGEEQRQTVSQRNSAGRTRFRWRPALQFRTWLERIQPQEVPPHERATVKAQIAEIRAKLQEWEAALEGDEGDSPDNDTQGAGYSADAESTQV